MFFLLILNIFAYGEDSRFGYISSISLPWYSGNGWDKTLDETDSADNNPIVGFSLGVSGERPFNSLFSLRGAVMVSAAGGGMTVDSGEDEPSSLLISEINLDVPVLLKWSFFRKGRRAFYLIGGPQISILLYQAQFVQEGAEFHKTYLDRDLFAPVGFGAVSGLGMDVLGRRFSVFMEVNYLREFTRTMSSSGAVYQNSFSFTSGIRWKDLLR